MTHSPPTIPHCARLSLRMHARVRPSFPNPGESPSFGARLTDGFRPIRYLLLCLQTPPPPPAGRPQLRLMALRSMSTAMASYTSLMPRKTSSSSSCAEKERKRR